MKAVTIAEQGSPVAANIAVVDDWPDEPQPGPGQLRVKTLATSLNHLDLWVGIGLPGIDLTYPRISGSDACGVVEAVGPGVHDSWIGRKIIINAAHPAVRSARPDDPPSPATHHALVPVTMFGEHDHGGHRAHFTIDAANARAIADDVDPIHAAAYGLTFLTAYSMMVTKAKLHAGQHVLITGIGGGVALAALAIAKHHACRVCVTSRHQWKLDRAKELGADDTILDDGQDWSRDARAATGKRGFDLAVDSVGKATHLQCIKSLAFGGAYVTPGCTTGPDATTDLARIFWNQLRILGSTMGTNDEFAEVVALFNQRTLAPVIDAVFPVSDAQNAYERIEAGEQFGKVVIDWR